MIRFAATLFCFAAASGCLVVTVWFILGGDTQAASGCLVGLVLSCLTCLVLMPDK